MQSVYRSWRPGNDGDGGSTDMSVCKRLPISPLSVAYYQTYSGGHPGNKIVMTLTLELSEAPDSNRFASRCIFWWPSENIEI